MAACSIRLWILIFPSPHGTTTRVLPKHTVTFISLIPERTKPRGTAENHPKCVERRKRVDPQLLKRVGSGFCALRPGSGRQERSGGSGGAAGWRPPCSRVDSVPETSKENPVERERTTGQLTTDTACAPHVPAGTKNVPSSTSLRVRGWCQRSNYSALACTKS